MNRRSETKARHDYYLTEAGHDPAVLTYYRRRKILEQLRVARAKAKNAKQSGVKRLHAMRRIKAMPAWADKVEIEAIYNEARRLTLETGVPHEVDHELPLLGKNVSGLHVEYNLRVVTRTVNRRKCNRLT